MLDEAYPQPMSNVLLWAVKGLTDARDKMIANNCCITIGDEPIDNQFIKAMQKCENALEAESKRAREEADRLYYAQYKK